MFIMLSVIVCARERVAQGTAESVYECYEWRRRPWPKRSWRPTTDVHTYIEHAAVLESYSKLPVKRPSLSLWANQKAAHERGTDEPLRKSCQNGFQRPMFGLRPITAARFFFFTFELKDRLVDLLGYQLSLRGTWASIDPIRVVFASATNDVGPDRGAGGNFQESKLIRIA